MRRALLILCALGCGKILDRLRPHDAGVVVVAPLPTPAPPPTPIASAPIDAGEDEDADIELLLQMLGQPDVPDAGCPEPVHPGYCRRRCKSFLERSATHHAERITKPASYALGKCSKYDVFAEKEADGRGIVEYYDSGSLIAARDDRQTCGKYGPIPACVLALKWTSVGSATPQKNSDEELLKQMLNQ